MSKISLAPNISGSATFTIAAPNSNSDRTLTLPDNSGTLLSNASTAGFPAGSVLQVVSVTKADVFSTASTSYVDITGFTASITPSSATSKILIIATLSLGNSTDDSLVQLVRTSTALNNGTGGSVDNGFGMVSSSEANATIFPCSTNYLDSPSTTSATTYKVQILTRSGTVFVNRRGSNASFGGSSGITLMEIAA